MSISPLSNLAPAMLISEVTLAMVWFYHHCFPALGLVEIPDSFFPFLFFFVKKQKHIQDVGIIIKSYFGSASCCL